MESNIVDYPAPSESGYLYATVVDNQVAYEWKPAVAAAVAPTVTPPAGIYTTAQSIVMATATVGAVIHYTLDGSLPTEQSPAYVQPLSTRESVFIRAVALAPDMPASAVTESDISIQTVLLARLQPAGSLVVQEPSITRSTDNGITWVPANGIASQSFSLNQGNGVVMYGGSYGYYRSTDAGASWTFKPLAVATWDSTNGAQYFSQSFSNQRFPFVWIDTKWFCVLVTHVQVRQGFSTCVLSSASGKVFQRTAPFLLTKAYPELNTGTSYSHSTRRVFGGSVNGRYLLCLSPSSYLTSDNNGSTWTERLAPNNCIDRGIAVTSTGIVANGECSGYVYHSPDGVAWNLVQSPASGNTYLVVVQNMISIVLAWHIDSGGDTTLSISRDGGLTFTESHYVTIPCDSERIYDARYYKGSIWVSQAMTAHFIVLQDNHNKTRFGIAHVDVRSSKFDESSANTAAGNYVVDTGTKLIIHSTRNGTNANGTGDYVTTNTTGEFASTVRIGCTKFSPVETANVEGPIMAVTPAFTTDEIQPVTPTPTLTVGTVDGVRAVIVNCAGCPWPFVFYTTDGSSPVPTVVSTEHSSPVPWYQNASGTLNYLYDQQEDGSAAIILARYGIAAGTTIKVCCMQATWLPSDTAQVLV